MVHAITLAPETFGVYVVIVGLESCVLKASELLAAIIDRCARFGVSHTSNSGGAGEIAGLAFDVHDSRFVSYPNNL